MPHAAADKEARSYAYIPAHHVSLIAMNSIPPRLRVVDDVSGTKGNECLAATKTLVVSIHRQPRPRILQVWDGAVRWRLNDAERTVGGGVRWKEKPGGREVFRNVTAPLTLTTQETHLRQDQDLNRAIRPVRQPTSLSLHAFMQCSKRRTHVGYRIRNPAVPASQSAQELTACSWIWDKDKKRGAAVGALTHS